MKNIFLISNTLPARFRFIFIMAGIVFFPFLSFSQTNFYNAGADITVNPSTILYVDGHLSNSSFGFIHNQGNIYFTGDWTNSAPMGCLDPNTGSVFLYGTTQTIQGSAPTIFNNLDLQGLGTKTLNVNTFVAGNSGVLSLNSNPLDLKSNTVVITNPAPTAITRTSGYIISETDSGVGYGKIQWNIGNSLNNYTFPFGTISGTYIPFFFDVTEAGTQDSIGNVSVATYPTAVASTPNNRPLPSGVNNLNDASGDESDVYCTDRFWIVDEADYSTNPIADFTFTYRDEEWDNSGGSTNILLEDSLKGNMWNGTQWISTTGTCNTNNNTVNVKKVSGSAPWTLYSGKPLPFACGKFTTPNAFSPNNDGHSDLFILQGAWEYCVASFHIAIFNRWGEKVFETENIAEGWDGNFKGKALDPGVFVYYIKAQDITGENLTKKGNISLIR